MKRLRADTIYNFSVVGNYTIIIYGENDMKEISPSELSDDLFIKATNFIEAEFDKAKNLFLNDIQGMCDDDEEVTNINFVLGTEKSNLNIICNKRFSPDTRYKILEYVKLSYYNGWGNTIETHEFERDDTGVYYINLSPSNANLRIS